MSEYHDISQRYAMKSRNPFLQLMQLV